MFIIWQSGKAEVRAGDADYRECRHCGHECSHSIILQYAYTDFYFVFGITSNHRYFLVCDECDASRGMKRTAAKRICPHVPIPFMRRWGVLSALACVGLVITIGVIASAFAGSSDNTRPAAQEQQPLQPKANTGYEQPDQSVLGAQPADAKLTVAGSTVYLSDMNDFGGKPCATGWRFGRNGTLGKDTDPKEMMVVNGRRPTKGLGMHPPMGDYTRVCYSLGKKAKSFEGSVAISGDQGQSFSGVRFLILGDGKVLWRSNTAQRKGVEQAFSVDVSNVNIIELRVHVEGGNNTLCWAVWADPLVKVK